MAQPFDGEILALDLATRTGWARGRPGQDPTFGRILLHGDKAERYRELRAWLAPQLSQVDRVIYESAAVPMLMMGRTNTDAIRFLIGCCEHVEELCHGVVELYEVRVSAVRVHFIGRNLKRDLAKAQTRRRCEGLGWMVTNDDEADAAALWSYAVCLMRPDLAHLHSPLFRPKRRVATPPPAV
jgi:crossover junction endodeoxyribonuclease RuvC